MHVLIATYTEPQKTVNESVRRFLAAPTPLDMEVKIYVCDESHAKSTGPGKHAFVRKMRSIGTSFARIYSTPTLKSMLICGEVLQNADFKTGIFFASARSDA